MKNYTINNGSICYGGNEVYALGRYQKADTIRECAENVHQYLLENADISMLGDRSIFDLRIFSCSSDEFPYIVDALEELNHDLQEEPDDAPYFPIDNSAKMSDFFGDILVKWDYRAHCYKLYDMGITDLQTLHNLLVFD